MHKRKEERQRDQGEVQAKNVVADVDELPDGGYAEASLLLYSNPMMHGTYSVTQIALIFGLLLRLSAPASRHVSISVCGSAGQQPMKPAA